MSTAQHKTYTEEEVRLAIEGAIAQEREACAQIVESFDVPSHFWYMIRRDVAAEVRTRRRPA